MYVRSHNFLVSILPSSAVVVLVETLYVQFNWYQAHRRRIISIRRILHWKCRIWHKLAAGIQILVALIRLLVEGKN